MEEFAVVENYLRRRRYPDGLSKGEKANLRRKCRKNFLFEGGLLYYRRANGADEWEEEPFRICVRTEEEKVRIMESCHAGVEGMLIVHCTCVYCVLVWMLYPGGWVRGRWQHCHGGMLHIVLCT